MVETKLNFARQAFAQLKRELGAIFTMQTEFEIIGKVSGNLLIYKNTRNAYSISVYDLDMKQKDRIKLDFLPDRIINADFLAYADYSYIFYQYQKRLDILA